VVARSRVAVGNRVAAVHKAARPLVVAHTMVAVVRTAVAAAHKEADPGAAGHTAVAVADHMGVVAAAGTTIFPPPSRAIRTAFKRRDTGQRKTTAHHAEYVAVSHGAYRNENMLSVFPKPLSMNGYRYIGG